jgi:hypothetical protein
MSRRWAGRQRHIAGGHRGVEAVDNMAGGSLMVVLISDLRVIAGKLAVEVRGWPVWFMLLLRRPTVVSH